MDAIDSDNSQVNGLGFSSFDTITDTWQINDFTTADLALYPWVSNPERRDVAQRALQRVAAGQAEYLTARRPDGLPIAICSVDYASYPDAGIVQQVVMYSYLRGLGLGTRLISAAEERIRLHGRPWARLQVEQENTRATSLYLRLGYERCGQDITRWSEKDELGKTIVYHAQVDLLRKQLLELPAQSPPTQEPPSQGSPTLELPIQPSPTQEPPTLELPIQLPPTQEPNILELPTPLPPTPAQPDRMPLSAALQFYGRARG